MNGYYGSALIGLVNFVIGLIVIKLTERHEAKAQKAKDLR